MNTDAEEERLSIEAARAIIIQAVEDGLAINDELIERASAAVHQSWLNRHPHPADRSDFRPYSDLTEVEKEKDRRFARLAAEGLTSVST